MPVNVGDLTSATARGLRHDFRSTYERLITLPNPFLDTVMQRGIPSDKLQEVYGYIKAAPHPERQDRNESPAVKAQGATNFAVSNYPYALTIPWHQDDEEDDQSDSLRMMVEQGATGFSIIPERIAFQIINAGTDNSLLPFVPSAPDGAALYATTAGGANRFGVANGNLISGTGTGGAMPSVTALRNDIYNAIEQMARFQDGEGQPWIPQEMINRGVLVVFGISFLRELEEAFDQKASIQIFSPTSGDDVAASVSNIFHDVQRGQVFKLFGTPRITTNDIHLFLMNAPHKPLFEQIRSPLKEFVSDMTNSDSARMSQVNKILWRQRSGYGVSLPYQTVKINNA